MMKILVPIPLQEPPLKDLPFVRVLWVQWFMKFAGSLEWMLAWGDEMCSSLHCT
jgi:hypothetical protein